MAARSGYLNAAARAYLEDGGVVPLRVKFQTDDATGQLSVVAHPDGVRVTRGRVTVTRLTATTKGRIPVTLLLAPAPARDEDYDRETNRLRPRLIVSGVKP